MHDELRPSSVCCTDAQVGASPMGSQDAGESAKGALVAITHRTGEGGALDGRQREQTSEQIDSEASGKLCGWCATGSCALWVARVALVFMPAG
jgi:hypothetical protein